MVIPDDLQAVLWSKSISKLDREKDKDYIIHQILSSGTWKHLKWLFSNFEYREIKDVFINKPAKNYTERNLNFLGNIIFGFSSENIDKNKYVKTYPRIIG